jgi:hypothetical protein
LVSPGPTISALEIRLQQHEAPAGSAPSCGHDGRLRGRRGTRRDVPGAALLSALGAAAKFAPVENVGFDWIDFALHVDDLRTSLITHPDNGRLPALVDGVRRVPTVEDIIAALTDPRDGPPGGLPALLEAFGSVGKRDSYQNFNLAERCLTAASIPLQPGVGDNFVQIIQAGDTVVLLTDAFRRIIALDGKDRVSEKLRSASGVSTGHWDRDTLVVDTRHFDGRAPSFAGAGTSREKADDAAGRVRHHRTNQLGKRRGQQQSQFSTSRDTDDAERDS